ncbi:MAG TPA: CAP domain-containing protein [Thermoanaerobaculia bacterium]|nr:CAP domain-containing protein [Thermoanaerobaculia bacterium]
MRARLAVLVVLFAAVPLVAQSEFSRASVVAAMNVERALRHLPPLREDPRLDAAAADRVEDMLSLRYWAHDAPDGRTPFDFFMPRGYSFLAAAENLAAGFDSVQRLISGWMSSRGHRENILSPEYEDCGVAILDGSTTHPWWRGKSVVVLFGKARASLSR